MKTKPCLALILISLLGSLLGLAACSNDSTRSKQTAVATAQVDTAATANSENEIAVERLESPRCANPIAWDDNLLRPIMSKNEMPKGLFILSSLESYNVYEDSNDSFMISAKAGNEFKPYVECNGLQDPTSRNVDRNWTDSDGGTHSEHAEHSNKRSSNVSIGEWMDTANLKKADKQRKIEVHFENGKLISATTERVFSDAEELKTVEADEMHPIDRLAAAPDTFVSLRIYSMPGQKLEVRMKVEMPADEHGYRTIMYSRSIFKRK